MVIPGKTKDGQIVPDNDVKLPEGAAVRIEILDDEARIQRLEEEMEPFAGCMDGLPDDMAE